MQTLTVPPAAVSRRKRVVFALAASLLVAILGLGVLLTADIYAHHRTQEEAGVNIWGYRGRPVGPKPVGAVRLVLLGGSTAYGWGLPAHESIAAFLERRLRGHESFATRDVSVVNLGAPAQGAFGFVYDLDDYAYLDYDVVVLYEGLNDLGPYVARGIDNDYLYRRESPVFRLTGYYPVLPVVLRDRARSMMAGGDIHASYAGGQVEFTPNLATRAGATMLRTAAVVAERVGAQLGGLSENPPPPNVAANCIPAWRLFCGRVKAAVSWALQRDKRVVFVTQPYMSDAHVEQQANVAAMLASAFPGDARLRYVNLGHLIDMSDRSIAYDGVHLVARGNDTVAGALVDPVLDLLPLSRPALQDETRAATSAARN
jgi:hypothetical protein